MLRYQHLQSLSQPKEHVGSVHHQSTDKNANTVRTVQVRRDAKIDVLLFISKQLCFDSRSCQGWEKRVQEIKTSLAVFFSFPKKAPHRQINNGAYVKQTLSVIPGKIMSVRHLAVNNFLYAIQPARAPFYVSPS